MDNLSAENKATLLMLLSAVENIVNSDGNVSDEVLEELEFILPELEKLLFGSI